MVDVANQPAIRRACAVLTRVFVYMCGCSVCMCVCVCVHVCVRVCVCVCCRWVIQIQITCKRI